MSKKITWKTEIRKVKDLIPADYNPRSLSSKERADLQASIEEFGVAQDLIVNIGGRKDVLIGGHQRTSIYADLGIEEVEVKVPSRELSKTEEQRLNLRLNKNTGSWDIEKLGELDMEMLIDVGFGDAELAGLWDDVDIIDDEPQGSGGAKEIKEARTITGDVWQLGQHKLMCGDSLNDEHVAKLMGKEKADMVYCDPPYNIGLNYNKGVDTKGKYGEGERFNKDAKDAGGYREFIDISIDNALRHTAKDAHVFYWCDEVYIYLMQSLFIEHKLINKRVCLWVKNNSFPKPQIAFNKCYEPCVYAVKGQPYLNKDMTKLTEILNKDVENGNQIHDQLMEYFSIWLEKKDDTSKYEHPTQKPASLHERPLKRCTAPGHIVLDLFGGSGSTLIACEQIGRKARLMEQDPIFATGIINRWEDLTGQKAKKIS